MSFDTHGLFRGMEISSTGMSAERARLNIIASNIANAEVTHTKEGRVPYRRKTISFAPLLQDLIKSSEPWDKAAAGVKVSSVQDDQSPFPIVYRPGHPDADESGNVTMPNVNMTFEMVDMMTALRAYEANLAAARSFKDMANKIIQMGR